MRTIESINDEILKELKSPLIARKGTARGKKGREAAVAAAEDLTALTRLRRTAGDSAEDAAGWLQRVAGLESILLEEKPVRAA